MKIYQLLFLFLVFACSEEYEVSHTNVLIILTDDLGYGDLGCYGSSLNETPNLDKMAAEGVKFTSYYAAQAVCSASRAAILTGCYPNRLGIHNAFMPNANKGLNPSETTIAEMLKGSGYATACYGKWHLGDHESFLPLKHGFDEYYGIPYSNDMWPYHPQQGPVFDFGPLPLIEGSAVVDTINDQSTLTVDITQKSVDFIKRNKENPFFLYLAHPQPHVPLYVSDKFKGKSNNGLYGDVIMELDWSVGEILKTLRESDLEKNTLVVFTSDNGPWLAYGNHAGSSGHFREGKGTAWEGGQREPFIAWMPGTLTAGTSNTAPFYAMDLMPTVAALTGAQLPYLKIDGMNVWEMWTGESKGEENEIFYYYYKTNELHAIRYGDWKMVFPHNYRTMFAQKSGRDGLPGEYAYIDLKKTELYNLNDDPEESKNVYASNLNVVAEMERIAEKAREELGDSLLGRNGKGSRKPGKVNVN